jgi:3-phosphoshikimate 1-carboxyvinyltransferase
MQKVIFSEKSSIEGYIRAPPSKSHSHRLLFLALISKKPIWIEKILGAHDIEHSIQACKQLGLNLELRYTQSDSHILWYRCIPPKELKSEDYIFNCGNSGTTARFLIGLSLAIHGKIHVTGEFFDRNRPVLPMLKAMKNIGTNFSEDVSGFTIETPHIVSNSLRIPGHFSSQFISGLLYGIISLCLRKESAIHKSYHYKTFTIETSSPQVSIPYIELTLQIFEQFGIHLVMDTSPDGCIKIVIPTASIKDLQQDEFKFKIPGDYSAITPFLCGFTLFGRRKKLSVQNLTDSGFQLNIEILEILRDLGLVVDQWSNGIGLEFYPPKNLFDSPKKLIINCMGIPDLFPSLCILGSFLPGTTTLTHIDHVRYKESNRVELMVTLLREFGIQIEESNSSITIYGNPNIELQKSHTLSDVQDHRILMAFMIFALGLTYNDFQLIIENVERIADSYPQFLRDLSYHIGAKFVTEKIEGN